MSKIGPHVIRPTADALEWARVAPVVKSLDPSALWQAPAASILVYRHYFPNQDINRHGADVLTDVLTALGGAPATHVELFNETAQRVGQGLERYVAMTREAIRSCNARRPDLTVVAFCFSTGQPERDDWEYLRAQDYGEAEVIGLHGYWGFQGFTPWHALRHRQAHAWTDAEHPPFLITECGRDRVEGGHGGWRADGLTEDQYVAELRAYEAELLKDVYVIAATPFTGGPTPDWEAFSTDPISGRMAALATPLPPQEPPMAVTKGIDIANHQGTVDLGLVRADGYAFVAMKASGDEGGTDAFLDPLFAQNWHGARAEGLARIAYHYARPSRVSPAASVTTLERALQAVGGLTPGDNVALDLEDPGVADGTSLHVWAAEWLGLAEQVFGVRAFKYSARYYTSTHDLEHPDLARWPTWWAAWQATVPAPVVGWGPIALWQNSDRATVPGVGGACDTDVFFGTVAELRALGLPGSAEPPPAGFDVEAARGALWATADELEANGWYWFAAGVKSAVAQSKGEH